MTPLDWYLIAIAASLLGACVGLILGILTNR